MKKLLKREKAEPKVRSGKFRYGSLSALLAGILIAVLIVLNIGAERLEKQYGWRQDYSYNSITTNGEITKDTLDRLQHPVHIWALYRKGSENGPLLELLDRYAAESALVTWEQQDPSLDPALIARFTTAAETPAEDSLIVFCEDTGLFRILAEEDFVEASWDEESDTFASAGWAYERNITNAIAYVAGLQETAGRALIVQGHGELDGETTAAFAELLTANRYQVAYVSLTAKETELKPQDLLIFLSPQRDLDEEELKKVSDFAAAGGSFLFACDYVDPIAKMPNYAALLRSYGFVPLDGIVVADKEEEETYYNGNRIYLIPEMCSTDLTVDLLTSGADRLLMPGARAFESPEETDRNLTVGMVLKSGETAYRKVLTAQTTSMDRGEGDEEGPFALCLQARRVTTAGNVSRAWAIGCSAVLTDETMYAMTDSQQLVIRTMEFLLDLEGSSLGIMAKDALRPTLGTGSIGLGSVLLVALPALVLLAALLVLVIRRRR